MAKPTTLACPHCGYANKEPVPDRRCVSCGASVEPIGASLAPGADDLGPSEQRGFNILWFLIATGIIAVLTGAVVVGLPRLVPLFDFEGAAGMLVAIPVWFVGGLLVGLISPGKTFSEPAAAVLVVALPTAVWLYQGQTVKTMPAFMYLLFSALGLLFTLVGAHVGERLQLGEHSHQ